MSNPRFEHAVREAFPDLADCVLAIIRGTRGHALTYATAAQRDRESYHPHDTATLKLEAVNEVLGGSGVESVPQGDGRMSPTFDYVNLGETYTPTLIYFPARRAWRVISLGDLIEGGDYA